jgi:hypothetical protein
MATSANNEIEKIKILYGESLRDIEDLTTRIEKVSGQFSKSSKSIDNYFFSTQQSSFRKGIFVTIFGGVLCLGVGFGVGFITSKSLGILHAVEVAREVDSANSSLAAEKLRVTAEIERLRAASGWAGSLEGRLAKKFFEVGGGANAALCKGMTWEILSDPNDKNVNWCIPKRRDLIGGEDKFNYGWKIP